MRRTILLTFLFMSPTLLGCMLPLGGYRFDYAAEIEARRRSEIDAPTAIYNAELTMQAMDNVAHLLKNDNMKLSFKIPRENGKNTYVFLENEKTPNSAHWFLVLVTSENYIWVFKRSYAIPDVLIHSRYYENWNEKVLKYVDSDVDNVKASN